ncbi:MAG: RNA degradosome polyphosphate kinase, partial [Gammaproteobacteria bacterium]
MQKTTEDIPANRTTRAQPKKRSTAAAKSGSNATSQKPPARRPRARSPQGIDLDDPALYLNRELTWLEFNRRVLDMAADDDTPLLE